jgi:adenylate cyclase
VLAFIVALAALLIAIQVRALSLATGEAASAYMDAASTKAVGHLETEIAAIASLVRVLAASSTVTDTDQRTLAGPAIPLFKTALVELPQLDSIYVGFQNGAWLQVRGLSNLDDQQREMLRATPPSISTEMKPVSCRRPRYAPADVSIGGSRHAECARGDE